VTTLIHTVALSDLKRGAVATVARVDHDCAAASHDAAQPDAAALRRLRDLGFVPGARCEIVARMWPAGDPIAVRVGGSTFALRRVEAAAVAVHPDADSR
jgi:ferrous iron transport protein A